MNVSHVSIKQQSVTKSVAVVHTHLVEHSQIDSGVCDNGKAVVIVVGMFVVMQERMKGYNSRMPTIHSLLQSGSQFCQSLNSFD